MSSGKEELLELGDARLYYEVIGEERPVVLLHTDFVDMRVWEEQVPALLSFGRVVRYDLVGYGRSLLEGAAASEAELDEVIEAGELDSYLERQLDSPAAHEDLRELLDHLGIESAILLGHETGAAIAIDFALEYPRRVEALVLVSPGLQHGPFSEEWFEWMDERAEAWAGRMGMMDAPVWDEMIRTGDASPFIDMLLQDPAYAPGDERARRSLRRIMVDNSASMLSTGSRTGAPEGPPATRRLGEIEAPTFVVAGERDDAGAREIAERIAREVPGARKAVVPGASRFVNLERPEEFNRLVLDFLCRL
jgi:3-oxoadipate enol-lactonase